MRRSIPIVAGLAITMVFAATSTLWAGRTGGPIARAVYVPAGDSVYFAVPFNAGEAVVAIAGDGQTFTQVFIHDSDGHVAAGVGSMDRKIARMTVYRPGTLRVQITNGGIRDVRVRVRTN